MSIFASVVFNMYRLKKSLGQHFLKDRDVIDKIIEFTRNLNSRRLLEVGPGGGALTEHLIQMPDIEFKAVEIDDEKIDYLKTNYPSLRIIHDSFLEISPPFEKPFSVIGNFPYNISSQILFKILDWFPLVENVVGMFQKEVAMRIISGPGTKDFGILSVLVQYYYEGVYLFDVKKESFTPPPKVESGVVMLTAREKLIPVKSEDSFKKIVKASFAQRRKTLRNNLKGILTAEKLNDSLFDRRAETLSVEEFAELTFFGT